MTKKPVHKPAAPTVLKPAKPRKHDPAWDVKDPNGALALLVQPLLADLGKSRSDLARATKMNPSHVYNVLAYGRSLPEKYWTAWCTFLRLLPGSPGEASFRDAAYRQSLAQERKKGILLQIETLVAEVTHWKARALAAESALARHPGAPPGQAL